MGIAAHVGAGPGLPVGAGGTREGSEGLANERKPRHITGEGSGFEAVRAACAPCGVVVEG